MTGALPEFEPSRRGLLRRRLDPRTLAPSLESIRSRLDRILADGRARGVILRVENLDAGWATLEELRAELHRFREKGKTVAAYLVDPDTRSYYLASAADEIFASPLSTLNVVGLRARVNFLKDALGSLGLETEVVAVSPYKSAADPISRSDFSPESREQTERLLDARFDELVSEISAGRDIPPERIKTIIDNAPYSAAEAVRNKLIDGALYEDELAGRLSEGEKPARLAEWGVASKSLRLPYRSRGARKAVGLVRVEGTIVRGRSRKLPLPLPLLGREQAGTDSVVASLRVAEKSRRISAVLLYVDSPGGDALASDLIWREVERIRAKKPIVVLMGNAAASGGYYVSAAASHVVARRGTLTGSIGVLAIRPIALGLYEKLGINPVALERGARAGLLDPSRRPSPDELRVIEGQIGRIYAEFKDRVARGRRMELLDLEGIAGGRVWTGIEALDLGLVDETGGFREALRKARELGGIERDVPGVLTKVNPPRSGRPSPGEPAQSAVDAIGEMWLALSELRAGGFLALAPYEISEG
ncbi:MAG: S49 family peptidase [Gemmatimonadetes bacterium]|nr:S49 family peptidase [Gemmatimonadota bacterium]